MAARIMKVVYKDTCTVYVLGLLVYFSAVISTVQQKFLNTFLFSVFSLYPHFTRFCECCISSQFWALLTLEDMYLHKEQEACPQMSQIQAETSV